MWRKILTVVAVICLLAGIGFLLFTPVSTYVGQKQADAVIEDFEKTKENITETITTEDGEVISSFEEAKEKGIVDEEGEPDSSVSYYYTSWTVFSSDLDRLKEDSLAYNEKLLNGQGTDDTTDFLKPALYLPDYGIKSEIYGYITIDAINLRQPIYLGASKGNMKFGAAHLYGTSLPVGDMDATVALAGHTDYTGKIFFDHIRDLQIGDTIKISTYWDDLEYRVIGSKTVTADQSEDLVIQEGRELLTLITCVPDEEREFRERYLVLCEKAG